MPSLIGEYEDHSFTVFMDDHASSATTFDTQFKFLHEQHEERGSSTYVFGAATPKPKTPPANPPLARQIK